MSATLEAIRAGMEKNLARIPKTQVSGYMLANPTPPTVQVAWPDDVQYHETMQDGTNGWVLIVMAFGGLQSELGAQKILDQFIAPTGAKSVKAAIEHDKTLGGIVDDLIVHSCSGYREYVVNTLAYLGCQWRVEIVA